MLPISTRTILACRDTLAAAIVVRASGTWPTEPSQSAVDQRCLPGVKVTEWESLPGTALPIEAAHIPELHGLAMAQAWGDGAWDMAVSLQPPLHGPSLGLVTAHTDWEAADQLRAPLVCAAQRGRLAYWQWRPMKDGPALRRKAHGRRDATLRPDGGRDGPPLATRLPDWAYASWHRCVRLGRAPDAERSVPTPRRATSSERAYIVALRRRTGVDVGAPLPASLGAVEASAMIDRLRSVP